MLDDLKSSFDEEKRQHQLEQQQKLVESATTGPSTPRPFHHLGAASASTTDSPGPVRKLLQMNHTNSQSSPLRTSTESDFVLNSSSSPSLKRQQQQQQQHPANSDDDDPSENNEDEDEDDTTTYSVKMARLDDAATNGVTTTNGRVEFDLGGPENEQDLKPPPSNDVVNNNNNKTANNGNHLVNGASTLMVRKTFVF